MPSAPPAPVLRRERSARPRPDRTPQGAHHEHHLRVLPRGPDRRRDHPQPHPADARDRGAEPRAALPVPSGGPRGDRPPGRGRGGAAAGRAGPRVQRLQHHAPVQAAGPGPPRRGRPGGGRAEGRQHGGDPRRPVRRPQHRRVRFRRGVPGRAPRRGQGPRGPGRHRRRRLRRGLRAAERRRADPAPVRRGPRPGGRAGRRHGRALPRAAGRGRHRRDAAGAGARGRRAGQRHPGGHAPPPRHPRGPRPAGGPAVGGRRGLPAGGDRARRRGPGPGVPGARRRPHGGRPGGGRVPAHHRRGARPGPDARPLPRSHRGPAGLCPGPRPGRRGPAPAGLRPAAVGGLTAARAAGRRRGARAARPRRTAGGRGGCAATS